MVEFSFSSLFKNGFFIIRNDLINNNIRLADF